MSHLIASATLSIPAMILGETALSFLGLGLRPPVTSWGVLLTEAQNINAVALYPWLMFPVVPVVITVLAFNFLGDGCAMRRIRTRRTDSGRPTGWPRDSTCLLLVRSVRYILESDEVTGLEVSQGPLTNMLLVDFFVVSVFVVGIFDDPNRSRHMT